MSTEVKVKVTGMQEGISDEEITTEAVGTMLYKEPYYYVSYEENIDRESDTKSKTVLRFSDTTLRVTRKGEVESVLEFSEGGVHNSIYMTAFGNFDVEVRTDCLTIEQNEKGAVLEVDYHIGRNAMLPAPGKLYIQIYFT